MPLRTGDRDADRGLIDRRGERERAGVGDLLWLSLSRRRGLFDGDREGMMD